MTVTAPFPLGAPTGISLPLYWMIKLIMLFNLLHCRTMLVSVWLIALMSNTFRETISGKNNVTKLYQHFVGCRERLNGNSGDGAVPAQYAREQADGFASL